MKRQRYLYSTILIGLVNLVVVSCSKVGAAGEDDIDAIDQNDDIFPVITVTRPAANQTYVSGDSIVVEGKVTDEKKMYKGKVVIKNDVTGFTEEAHYETHFLSTINFRLATKAIVTTPTDFSILVEFQDHGMNTSTATIKVKVNP